MVEERAVIAIGDDGWPAHLRGLDGVDWWTSIRVDFSGPQWSALPFQGEEMFVCRLGATQTALDTLAAEPDAYLQSEYGLSNGQISGFLNAQTGRTHSLTEWDDRLFVRGQTPAP